MNVNPTSAEPRRRGNGKVTFVVPAATYAELVRHEAAGRGLEINKLITLEEGNLQQAIAQATAESETAVIALIVETISDGAAFMQALRATGKPTVVLRAGRRGSGSRAIGQQGEISGAWQQLYEVAVEQAGGLWTRGIDDFFDATVVLASGGPLPSGNGVGIIGHSRALGVLTADASKDAGLQVPRVTAETETRLRQRLPGLATAENPVIHEQASAEDVKTSIELMSGEPNVGGIIVAGAPAAWEYAVSQVADKVRVVACLDTSTTTPGASGQPVACFPTPTRAARAYSALVKYAERKSAASRDSGLPTDPAVEPMHIEGLGVMDEHETKRLLDRWGVTVVPETLVTGPGRHEFTPVRKLAIHFGFPVALKAVRRDIVDKAGMGAVAFGLRTVDELQQSWEQMHERFPDAAWLVHPMLPGDVEVVVGARRDPVFGPYVFFGGGGIMTELYGDFSIRIAPLSLRDASDMIEETKVATLMRGFHGLPVHELSQVADVVVKVGQLMLGQPSVQQLEINPLLLTEKGPIVTDAMAVIG